MNRRDFLKSAAAVVAVQSVAIKVLAQSENSFEASNGALRVTSGESAFAPLPGHLHQVELPLSVLQDPPAQGLRLQTSRAFAHRHVVELSQNDLVMIAQGQQVTVRDTVSDHDYTFLLQQ